MKLTRPILLTLALAAGLPSLLAAPKRPAPVTAKITAIRGNLVTLRSSTGLTKTLEFESVKGLTVGLQTGWCEEDCGRLKVGSADYRIRRVVTTGN